MPELSLKKREGFTLVELLVSTAIIAMMSALVIANYRKGGQLGTLRMAAQRMASDIRMMEGNSMGLKTINGTITPGGWGIRGSDKNGLNNYYILFADVTPGGKFCTQNPSLDQEYQKVYLPSGIYFSKVEADTNADSYLYAVFLPPDPSVELVTSVNNENSPSVASSGNKKAIFTLKDSSGNTIKVTVNIFGLVDVE